MTTTGSAIVGSEDGGSGLVSAVSNGTSDCCCPVRIVMNGSAASEAVKMLQTFNASVFDVDADTCSD